MSDTQIINDVTLDQISIVPLTATETTQRQADAVAVAMQSASQLAADQLQATKLAAVNTKLAAIGLTVDDLTTLSISFKALP